MGFLATYLRHQGALAGVVALCGLGLSVGILSTMHADCNDSEFDGSCDDTFRKTWWAIAFQAAVLICSLATVLLRGPGDALRLVLVAFLALATVDVMDEAERALGYRDDAFWTAIGSEKGVVQALFPGFIAMAVGDFLLIMSFGITAEGSDGV